MLKIGICDDDKYSVQKLHDLLVKITFSYSDVEICHFENGQAVLEAIQTEQFAVDLLFLEIQMQKTDGIQIAEFIRKHDIDVDIIFLTNSIQHIYEGYTYKAYAYYLKPVKEELVKKDILRYLEERKSISETLTINTKSREIHIPIHKIIYFKSEKRRVTAYSLIGESSFYAKLDDIEKMIQGRSFIRCHQSYLVNSNMIDSIGRTEIIAQGISIPMSRKYYEDMDVRDEDSTYVRIHRSLAMNQKRGGAIVFVKGKLLGTILWIQCDKEITVGRNGMNSDVVVNEKTISRLHCGIRYNSQTDNYTIVDYSQNGIYKANGERMIAKEGVHVNAGEEICLGNSDNVIRLG